MEDSTIQPTELCNLETLVAGALEHLAGLGYRPATLSIYRGIWRALIRFPRGGGTDSSSFLEAVCSRFLASRGVPDGAGAGELSWVQILLSHAATPYDGRASGSFLNTL